MEEVEGGVVWEGWGLAFNPERGLTIRDRLNRCKQLTGSTIQTVNQVVRTANPLILSTATLIFWLIV